MARSDDRTSSETVDELRWHALAADDVAASLGTGTEGLGVEEVRERQDRYGPNVIEEAPPTSPWVILLHQFTSPLIYLLLVATVVTLALEEYVDAGVIAAVLVLNAVIGFFQERRAEESVRALMQLLTPHARVVRDARDWEIDSRELVPGDLVLLESGVRVPADLRLVSVTGLEIDESLLTGESLPVTKETHALPPKIPLADRRNLAFTGCVVTKGRGRGFVVATGAATELGAIAEHVRAAESLQTPLQQRMARFAQLIAIIVGGASAVLFGIGVALGEDVGEMFLAAVALAVAVVPEGLPIAFTVALALGVRRMAARQAVIRRLPAVETLGSTTVIGSDKTGTLTENRMTVQEVWAGGELVEVAGPPADGLPDHLRLTLVAGVLANEAEAYRTAEGFAVQGDPTEAAMLVAAAVLGVEPEETRAAYREEVVVPFESERRYSATHGLYDGEPLVFVKGAPERVLEMCRRIRTPDGDAELDPEVVHRAAREMAGRGLRVLGMAYARGDEVEPPGEGREVEPETLVFLGLQGMMDPPREGVAEAIAGCHDAGMRVVMITGDHGITARAIAQRLGIADADAKVLTGPDLDALEQGELEHVVRDVSVYARVAPEHKLQVVEALQAGGDVVAVTGDGVNDAPALKRADIGIAMGRSGTDVAREAADMVLTDDNFVSIYAAVEEGRVTFDNVRKVTFFLISTGAAAIVVILAALVLRWPLPLLPAQLLWLNLVTNGLQDVALAFEPGEPNVLGRPPRRRNEGVISPLLWERTLIAGAVMGVATLVVFNWQLEESGSEDLARTVALTTLVVSMAFHLGNSRSESRSLFRVNPLSNRFLVMAQAGALALHVGALYVAPTQFVLRLEPIGPEAWIRIVVMSIPVVIAVELHKLLRGRRGNADGAMEPSPAERSSAARA